MRIFILTIITCLISVNAFANKIISSNDEYVTFTENGSEGLRNYSTRFTVRDPDNTYYHYNVSYNLNINDSLCNTKSELYMQFLDKNGMLLHEEYIGECQANYVGTHRDIIRLAKNVLYDSEDVILIKRKP